MRYSAVILIMAIALSALGCEEDQGVSEVVSRPDVPAGPDTASCTYPVVFSTGGAVSNKGNDVEYRFDFDSEQDHIYGSWRSSASDTVVWETPGPYMVKAQARSSSNIDVLSPWSEGKEIVLTQPPVTRPSAPSGPASTKIGQIETFCTGGAVSSGGDPAEYRFDFDAAGSRDTTAWSAQTCLVHQWDQAGYYEVKAQARFSADPQEVSVWSDPAAVTVSNREVSTPGKPLGPEAYDFDALHLYCTGGAVSSDGHPLHYQFVYIDSAPETLYTDWSSDSCALIDLQNPDQYEIRARARSAAQTYKVSAWSQPLLLELKSGENPVVRFTSPDTVGMLKPFSISYHGVSPHGAIKAYAYYSPGMELEGRLRWNTDLSDTFRYFPNSGMEGIPDSDVIESGDFYFRAACIDEKGYPSLITADKGTRKVTVNFDPDTRVLAGKCFYRNTLGEMDSFIVDFHDGLADTLPYGSWVRINYTGWDDSRDLLEYTDPPVPIRFKYRLRSTMTGRDGTVAYSVTPFYPVFSAEKTNPWEFDSTTTTVGSCDYEFRVRAYDEQYRDDHTPASAVFTGNFQPTVDEVDFGVIYLESTFVSFGGDTVYLADPMNSGRWSPPGPEAIGDTLFPKVGNGYLYYEFALRARGHDDARDLPGSAVKSWRFNITGSGRDYDFSYEGVDLVPSYSPNELLRSTAIQVPLDNETGLPDSAFVAELSSYMGPQNYRVIGYDMRLNEIYTHKIRCSTPTFDDYWNIIEKGHMCSHESNVSDYARKDTLSGGFYLKTLW